MTILLSLVINPRRRIRPLGPRMTADAPSGASNSSTYVARQTKTHTENVRPVPLDRTAAVKPIHAGKFVTRPNPPRSPAIRYRTTSGARPPVR
jgi:hypothetical protein